MNSLVRILCDDDGRPKNDAHVWHLVDPANVQGNAALCTGEFFGEGESRVEFEWKQAPGGATCPRCIAIVNTYKAVRM
jgi:hypothetical protein